MTSASGSTHRPLRLSESLDYINSVFHDYLTYSSLSPAELRGRRVLELGPGDNHGVAIKFLAAGAKEVVSVDKFITPADDQQQRAIYAGLLECLSDAEIAALGGAVVLNGEIHFDRRRLTPIRGVGIEEAQRLLEPASFDLVVSRAVIEHIHDVDAAFAAMDVLLRPGGLMIHKIDFRDHGMFGESGKSLKFLTIPESLWSWMTRYSGGPNRHLVDYYRSKMTELGYRARFFVTHLTGSTGELTPHKEVLLRGVDYGSTETAAVEEVRPQLRGRFQNMPLEDLVISGVFLVAQKP
jgi:SAM-dependent methyltransferase